MESNVFAEVTRRGLRFNSSKGFLTIEQLWTLPLNATKPTEVDLEQIAQIVYEDLGSSTTVSFTKKANKTNTEASLKMEIVKYIIQYKQEAEAAAEKAAANKATRQEIMSILADKSKDALKNMSTEELTVKLNSLGE